MNLIVAKTAGFCFGVDKAVKTVYEQIEKSTLPVYTFGPIIHNETVVSALAEKGVKVLHSEAELEALESGTVIIRSHGVSRAVREKMNRPGIVCVDATCPFVAKIHRIVEEAGRMGETVVVAGNPDHPEVRGICGWATGPCFVIDSAEELRDLPLPSGTKLTFVAQTTYNFQKLKDFVEILKRMDYDVRVRNTVCSATEERQTEALQIAQKVDAMIVIGDRHSSNSRKLYEICNRQCKCTYFIETIVDLEPKPFQSISDIGITAGASTPKKLIEEVQNYVRSQF